MADRKLSSDLQYALRARFREAAYALVVLALLFGPTGCGGDDNSPTQSRNADAESPVPDDERPGGLAFFRDPPAAGLTEELAALKEALVRLDRICCAPQEYTLQATRPDFGAAS